MDDPDCDRDRLFATYAQFRAVNALVAGWRRVYLRDVRPVLDRRRASRLLDIGFGGGDIPLALTSWAARDGLRLEVTAIDPDERAHEFVESRGLTRLGVDFRAASSGELVAAGSASTSSPPTTCCTTSTRTRSPACSPTARPSRRSPCTATSSAGPSRSPRSASRRSPSTAVRLCTTTGRCPSAAATRPPNSVPRFRRAGSCDASSRTGCC